MPVIEVSGLRKQYGSTGSAIVVALLYGSWPARAAAALDLALLVFVGDIFGGLSRLDVAAVGSGAGIVRGGHAFQSRSVR